MSAIPSPVSPGKSPFHVRGSTYLGVRAHIDERVKGGMDAVLAHLPDEAHRAFSQQVFLPVAMYDALPLRTLTEATALAEGVPFEVSVRARARDVALRDLNGLYKLLLKAVSPATAAEKLQRAALRYFDFGAVDIVERGKNHCVIVQSGVPRFVAPWYCPMVEGYTVVVLEMAGAKGATAQISPPRRDGEREGIETVSVRIELGWR